MSDSDIAYADVQSVPAELCMIRTSYNIIGSQGTLLWSSVDIITQFPLKSSAVM